MAQAPDDLENWLKRVRLVKTREEVLSLLEEFRPLSWTDEQRSTMARLYIRTLESMGVAQTGSSKGQKEAAEGPVWYEKM